MFTYLRPAEFEGLVWQPKTSQEPYKIYGLAEKHWKGVISADDAQTFNVYDSFGLLGEQDEKVIAGAIVWL
jgi:hypothetical protein